MEILNERPVGMSFEDYRKKRSESNAQLRRYLKGSLYFCAAMLINIGSEKNPRWVKTSPKQNKTFIGSAKKDLIKPI